MLVAKGQGHRRKCSPKKEVFKIFFWRSQKLKIKKKGLQEIFLGNLKKKKDFQINFSGDLQN